MDIKDALSQVVSRQALTRAQMSYVMHQLMAGQLSPSQIGGFLVAMRMKGETVAEMAGAVEVMRELSAKVTAPFDTLVDTCGTGGDHSGLFNVSTASAFVVAAAGGKVAKHGNRSVTSVTGSADVLEAAGVNLTITPEQVGRCIEHVGLGFMFAPAHHSAMKHVAAIRRELGLRTFFNLLGPLTNPAGAKRQVIGVFDDSVAKLVAEVLNLLGSEHVMVVRSLDGLDELSLAAPSKVVELNRGHISEYEITPEGLGLQSQSLEGLQVASAQDSLALIRDALGERSTPQGVKAADMIALNAGAALYVAGHCSDLKMGVALAEDTIVSGLANEKITELAEFTRCFA